MLLLVDNGSVFTKDIANTLSDSNIKFEQMKFDEINSEEISKFDSQYFRSQTGIGIDANTTH